MVLRFCLKQYLYLKVKPKFLGKLIDISLSATKKATSKQMIADMNDLLTAADVLPIHGEYKVWIYRNYIIPSLQFHLCVDAVLNWTVAKIKSVATQYL